MNPSTFASRTVVNEDGCWIWQGAIDATGYGRVRHDGKLTTSHRVAYLLLVGPIPEGYQIDHLCRVRACCNPSHLEAVTQQENIRRSLGNGSKTHCPQGHPYDDANTYALAGRRYCRACKSAHARLRSTA